MQTKRFFLRERERERREKKLLFFWISLSEVLFSSRNLIPYWKMNVLKYS